MGGERGHGVTDIFDQAQELEQAQREAAIAAAREHVGHGGSYSHCEECGEPIPHQRQQAAPGCTRCIDCQSMHERTGR